MGTAGIMSAEAIAASASTAAKAKNALLRWLISSFTRHSVNLPVIGSIGYLCGYVKINIGDFVRVRSDLLVFHRCR